MVTESVVTGVNRMFFGVAGSPAAANLYGKQAKNHT